MTATYSFDEQLRIGKAAERLLDTYFSQWYSIEIIPHEIEVLIHSDRLFIDAYGHHTIVEYKADYIGHRTGNAYVETVSVASENKPGWVYTSQADVLIYWVVGNGQVIAVSPKQLREKLPGWEVHYHTIQARNETYYGAGVLVPISELRKLSIYEGELHDAAYTHIHPK